MSEFEGEADIQQIRFITLVMITVLLSSARTGHSHESGELPRCSITRPSRKEISSPKAASAMWCLLEATL
jgi:hypothetical protein